MALYQLIYQSISLVPFEEPELVALLEKSRGYNCQRHLSGLLLYTADGRFFQVLEGEQEAVRHLYFNRIVADPRHHLCRVFSEGPCPKRTFADWTMGFRRALPLHLRTLLSPVPSDIPGLLIPRPHTRAELMGLLTNFLEECEVETAREVPW